MYMILGLGLIVLGVLVLFSVFRSRRKAEQAKSWRTTDAIIVKSEVVVTGDGENRSVRPDIEYRYHVAGKELTGYTIGFTTVYNENMARTLVRKYPAGATVQLRYNPENADECCLEAGADPSVFLFLIGSAMLIGFGIFLITSGKSL